MNSVAVADMRPGWIISRGQDLLWLQGSVIAGVIFLAIFLLFPTLNSANYSVTHPAVLALLLWGVLFDGTHVFGTYSRTYFAPDEVSKSGLPGNSSWSWLLLGPAVALMDFWLAKPGPSLVGSSGWIFKMFLVFAYLWAYYHLIRQHYGIMVLYRRKESVQDSGNLDTYFLWLGGLYPYLRFSLSEGYINSGLPQLVPMSMLGMAKTALDVAFIAGMAGLLLMYLLKRRKVPKPLGPKHMFLAIVVGFHMLVFTMLQNLLVITAVLTIFHNLQYHRIVWLYESGHKRIPMGTIYRYLGFGAVFGLIWYGPRIMGVAVSGTDLLRNMLLGLGWGFAFHHYFVDARIWRVRRTPGVAQALDRGATA